MSPEKKPDWGVTSVEGHRYYTVYTGVPKISRFPRYILPCEMHTHTHIYTHTYDDDDDDDDDDDELHMGKIIKPDLLKTIHVWRQNIFPHPHVIHLLQRSRVYSLGAPPT